MSVNYADSRLAGVVSVWPQLRGEEMTEQLMHRWDDDTDARSVCSECLRAFGNPAACRNDIDPQEEAWKVCEYEAEATD
jgi:hypothetical protein